MDKIQIAKQKTILARDNMQKKKEEFEKSEKEYLKLHAQYVRLLEENCKNRSFPLKKIKTFEETMDIYEWVFSGDSKYFACFCSDENRYERSYLYVLDLETSEKVMNICTYSDGMAFSKDNKFLYVANINESMITTWEIKTRKQIHTKKHEPFHKILFSPYGDFYTMTAGLSTKVCDLKTHEPVFQIDGLMTPLRFTRDKLFLINDKTIYVWDIYLKTQISQFTKRGFRGICDVTNDGLHIAMVIEHCIIVIYDTLTGEKVGKEIVIDKFDNVEAVSFTGNGLNFVSFSGNNYFSVSNGILDKFEDNEAVIIANRSPDYRYLVTKDDDSNDNILWERI